MKGAQESHITYKVVRSRRSTVDIIVERDSSILVRAPEWADDDQIRNIVESKHTWIYQTLAEWRELNSTRVLREYKNGEGFLYLGRAYRLLLVGGQEKALQLKSGRFMLRRDVVEQGGVSAAREAFRDYYVMRGLERLPQRIAYFAPKVGVKPSGLDVRDLGHRWASCSPAGKLAFHWKCMMAPLKIIDYIVVHELCHFHQSDHNDAFWNEVDKVMPDYRERKEWLRKSGASLEA